MAASDKKTETLNASFEYKNEVTLTGTIRKVYVKDTSTIIVLAIRTTPTVTNYPKVVFFGDSAKEAAKFKEKNRATIHATIQSYDPTKLKEHQSATLLVGTHIEAAPAERTYEADDPNGPRPIESSAGIDKNFVEIQGDILSISAEKGNGISVRIRTITNRHISLVSYPYYANNSREFFSKVHVGDRIRAIGSVQTTNMLIDPEPTPADQSKEIEEHPRTDSAHQSAPRFRTVRVQAYLLYSASLY